MSPRARGWTAGIVVLVGATLAIGGLNSLGQAPSGPSLSSYATTGDGLAAVDELLNQNDHATTQLRVSLDKAVLAPDQTVVALGQVFSGDERRALRAFLRGGGRLVTGGPEAEPFLRTLVADLRWRAVGAERLRVASQVPEVTGLREVRAEGFGSWTRGAGTRLFEGEPNSAFELAVGDGVVVALADPSPLTNDWLERADNAGFAQRVAGPAGRAVGFAENGHGYGLNSGLAAVPSRWKAALWFGAIAALVGALAAGKRFGPVDVEPEALAPERTRYVAAVASTLARTRDLDAAVAPLRARGAELLRRRTGHVAADPADLAATARLAGLSAEDAKTLVDPIADERALVALGRTVSRLEEH